MPAFLKFRHCASECGCLFFGQSVEPNSTLSTGFVRAVSDFGLRFELGIVGKLDAKWQLGSDRSSSEEFIDEQPHPPDGDVHYLKLDRYEPVDVVYFNVVVRSWADADVVSPFVHAVVLCSRELSGLLCHKAWATRSQRAAARRLVSALWVDKVGAVLALLSPAKKLDFETPARARAPLTTPQLRKETKLLARTAAQLTAEDLAKLMKLSPSLAKLNFRRFQEFDAETPRPPGSRQAALAFDGDTYVGLGARELSKEDLQFAQEHVWILSGLYGVLRPLDAILPYRLEMGTRLSTDRGRSLYEFWGDRIALTVQKQLDKLGESTLVNLASNEYFSAVDQKAVEGPIIHPIFKEKRGGELKVVSFNAKRARGTMARYIIESRLTEPEGLKDFSLDGYRFQKKGSTGSQWLFVR